MKNFIKRTIDSIRRKPLLVKPVVSTCFFGHKWSEGRAKKICLRKGCLATKVLMYKKNPKIGEPSLEWHYYNMDKIYLK